MICLDFDWQIDEFMVYCRSTQLIRRYITDLQERGKYTFYAQDERKGTNYPERRRDFRKPISVVTINNYIRNLRVFFNWLERDYTIQRNPMKKIRLLKVNRQTKLYFSDDEFRKLISKRIGCCTTAFFFCRHAVVFVCFYSHKRSYKCLRLIRYSRKSSSFTVSMILSSAAARASLSSGKVP